MSPVFLPPKIRFSAECERCGMSYPRSELHCPHCADIKDGAELEAFKQQHQDSVQDNKGLGRIFIVVAAILAVIILIISGIG